MENKEIMAELENMGQGLYDVSIVMGKRLMSLPNEHQKFFSKPEAELLCRIINLPKKLEKMKKPIELKGVTNENERDFGYYEALEEIQSYIDKGE